MTGYVWKSLDIDPHKMDRQTDRQTDGRTDITTYRLKQARGPSQWGKKCFSKLSVFFNLSIIKEANIFLFFFHQVFTKPPCTASIQNCKCVRILQLLVHTTISFKFLLYYFTILVLHNCQVHLQFQTLSIAVLVAEDDPRRILANSALVPSSPGRQVVLGSSRVS